MCYGYKFSHLKFTEIKHIATLWNYDTTTPPDVNCVSVKLCITVMYVCLWMTGL